MDISLLKNSRSGQIVRSLEGHDVFLPNKLPPILDYGTLAKPIARAMQQIGELKGASKRTVNPYILIAPLQRREALTTSAMEGTYTTIEDLVLEEEGLARVKSEDARETSNFRTALRLASDALKKLPISHRVIKEAHRRLLSGLSERRGANKKPGEYKMHQNWIGDSKQIEQARYVPPSPELTPKCMDDLEAYINRPNDEPADKLVDLALAHYQFEAIHPFADGNGRIGRMLITLMAQESGLLDAPLLYLSPYFEKNKDEYVERMFEVSANSRWEQWVEFFLNAIVETCKNTTITIDQLISLQIQFRSTAAATGRSAKLMQIVDQLFESPYLTVPLTQSRFGVTYRGALLMLEKLVSAGILRELPGMSPKYYYAPEVLRISSGQ
jgi:Fic family protein